METPPPSLPQPRNEDARHLELLAVSHYVVAGLLALFACIPLIHVGLGILFVFFPEVLQKGQTSPEPVPPQFFGWLFIVLGGVFILLGWTVAAALAYAGRCLHRRRHRIYCLVVAGIACLFMPFGTVLGVFTLILLLKPSVIALFEAGPGSPPS
jgi:hypothetical protein